MQIQRDKMGQEGKRGVQSSYHKTEAETLKQSLGSLQPHTT